MFVHLTCMLCSSSISWVSKVAKNIGPTPGSSDSSVEQSYLIAVSLSNNVQLFEVGHNPFLTGDDEDTNDKDTVIALLPYKSLSSMSGKQISSILSKAQLGTKEGPAWSNSPATNNFVKK